MKEKLTKEIPIHAVCISGEQILAAALKNPTVLGCELTTQERSSGPAFPARTPLELNLLDESSGKSITVSARISSVRRCDSGWWYQLSWERLPELVKPWACTVEEVLELSGHRLPG